MACSALLGTVEQIVPLFFAKFWKKHGWAVSIRKCNCHHLPAYKERVIHTLTTTHKIGMANECHLISGLYVFLLQSSGILKWLFNSKIIKIQRWKVALCAKRRWMSKASIAYSYPSEISIYLRDSGTNFPPGEHFRKFCSRKKMELKRQSDMNLLRIICDMFITKKKKTPRYGCNITT